MFGREFHIKELIGIGVFAIIIMNKVFDNIKNDKSNKRREEEMTRKILMGVTEVKHGFLFLINIILVIIFKMIIKKNNIQTFTYKQQFVQNLKWYLRFGCNTSYRSYIH